MRKAHIVITLVLVILFMVSFAYAEEDLNSLRAALNNNSGAKYLDGQGKAELMGVSRDAFNIVRVIVVTIIMLKIFRLYGEFANAGENPAIKAKIKTKATWLALGLIFTINFWNIYSFLSKLF